MVAALGDTERAQWLDPCVGDGAFVFELADLGVPAGRVVAVDLERRPGTADRYARTVRGVDFLTWADATRNRFDRIIANPPYVALARLSSTRRRAAQARYALDGSPIPQGANYWLAFLAAALGLLRPGGALAFVLPAAWEYADYAARWRAALPGTFGRVEVHRSRQPLFPTVHDGSVVLIATEFGSRGDYVRFIHPNGHALVEHLRGAYLKEPERTSPARSGLSVVPAGTQLLRDVATIRIGAVTGWNDFFLLRESERRRLGIARSAVRPTLSRARHLVGGEIGVAAWRGLVAGDERIWLFHPRTADRSQNGTRQYLRSARGKQGRQAFKVTNRRPWYQCILPKPPDAFVSGMTRHGPWLAIRGVSDLTATNTLYVLTFIDRLTRDEQAELALSILTTSARKTARSLARLYPDGLLKYEPNDIGKLPVRRTAHPNGALETYKRAIAELLRGRERSAQAIADLWFASRASAPFEHTSRRA